MTYEKKVKDTRKRLRYALKAAKRPALWSSFGKKSLVTLDVIRALGQKVPVFWQRDQDPRGTRRDRFRDLVRKLDIEVMDYRPAEFFVFGGSREIRLAKIFDLNGEDLPIIFPLRTEAWEDEDQWDCIFKQLDGPRREHHPYSWDVTILGSTEERTPSIPEDGFRVGNTLLCFPLRHWLREDVARYLKENDVPEPIDPGEYSICANCIDPFHKDKGRAYCPLAETDIDWVDAHLPERNKLWAMTMEQDA